MSRAHDASLQSIQAGSEVSAEGHAKFVLPRTHFEIVSAAPGMSTSSAGAGSTSPQTGAWLPCAGLQQAPQRSFAHACARFAGTGVLTFTGLGCATSLDSNPAQQLHDAQVCLECTTQQVQHLQTWQ